MSAATSSAAPETSHERTSRNGRIRGASRRPGGPLGVGDGSAASDVHRRHRSIGSSISDSPGASTPDVDGRRQFRSEPPELVHPRVIEVRSLLPTDERPMSRCPSGSAPPHVARAGVAPPPRARIEMAGRSAAPQPEIGQQREIEVGALPSRTDPCHRRSRAARAGDEVAEGGRPLQGPLRPSCLAYVAVTLTPATRRARRLDLDDAGESPRLRSSRAPPARDDQRLDARAPRATPGPAGGAKGGRGGPSARGRGGRHRGAGGSCVSTGWVSAGAGSAVAAPDR